MKRAKLLVIIATLVIALASFVFFNEMGRQTASPNVVATPITTFIPPVYTPTFSLSPTASPLPPPPFTPAGTPLPTPDLGPSPTPRPTFTPAPPKSPTPVKPITGWLTYTSTMLGYVVSYPNTWYLEVSNPSNVFITSYPPPSFRGTGAVKIDVLVGSQPYLDNSSPGQIFCVDGQCGKRVDEKGPFTEPIKQGVNQGIAIEIQKGGKFYGMFATIQDPLTDAERNKAVVEKIISSFHFIK